MKRWAVVVAITALLALGERGIAEDTSWMELDAQAVALYQAGQYAEASAMTEDAWRHALKTDDARKYHCGNETQNYVEC